MADETRLIHKVSMGEGTLFVEGVDETRPFGFGWCNCSTELHSVGV